jgi:hypothetical protein
MYLFFQILFATDGFPHGQGVNRFLWSTGDPTGFALHGDFLSGWETDIMQKVQYSLRSPSLLSS